MPLTPPIRQLPKPFHSSAPEGRGWNAPDRFKKRSFFVVFVCMVSVVALLLLWQARSILLLLFAGYIGALILATLTSKFQSWFHLRKRGLAFSIVIVALVAGLAAGIWLRGPALVYEFGDLRVDIAAAVRELTTRFQAQGWGRWVIAHSGDSSQISRALSTMLSGVGGAIYLTASTIAGLFLIMISSIYLAAEPEFYLRGIRRVLPARHRTTIEACFAAATRMLRSWLLAKVVSMAIVGVFVTVGLLVLRVPLAGTLGTIAALLTFIPNLGPIVSVIPAALLAFAISPMKGILTIALFCVAHLLEGNIVTPLAERKIVRLPPALTLAVQLLLASLAGALGVALAAPLTAVMLGIAEVLLPPETGETPPHSADSTSVAKEFDVRVQAS
ncbi:MAG TPA: AI-2E family transporter [Terracidiphilus sp.]|nr:AI-2E family transporter [Terracidiphilus sp.]